MPVHPQQRAITANRPRQERPIVGARTPGANRSRFAGGQAGRAIVHGNRGGNRFAEVRRGNRFMAAVNHYHRPWGRFHHRWYHGSWGNWASYPTFWTGLASDTWLTPWAGGGGAFTYDNPYYDPSVYGDEDDDVPMALNYSQPIEAADDDTANDDLVRQAMEYFDDARARFGRERYNDALVATNQALLLLPEDRTIQEFRGLCLFALGRYTEASAVLYAVLAGGPGWDWDTMIALYADADTYTAQLRRLEAYVQDHPDDSAVHFLLGYHYLVLDDKPSAVAELRTAAQLEPRDTLSAKLADALSQQPPE